MKIDQAGDVKNLYPTQGKSAKRKTDTDSTSSSASSEQVAINPLASQINTVSQDMAAAPSFDVSKVEAIKSAIAAGSFQINPENIADGLISSTKQLLAG
ncbi:flagellar biosynthesis anti-sigma factor FlgM [Paludibacterium sp.]|uniref:flagellar biosynthesis anti-sigma factor FlgM n=1 Tax=Paludibacterium sp. TaxID=1917523 RepID=UPI0025F3831F|nr:flagellar biosynthesis anti-sigma factor FlgM [Paludibacterium sp.]MBV8646635.1 flagellar biosynthesis anti-sigma factor FlgM [Paludibacterium sp.]